MQLFVTFTIHPPYSSILHHHHCYRLDVLTPWPLSLSLPVVPSLNIIVR